MNEIKIRLGNFPKIAKGTKKLVWIKDRI